MVWWNSKYPFRHAIGIQSETNDPVPVDHPIYVDILKSSSFKILPSYNDVRVIREDSEGNFTELPRSIIDAGAKFRVVFLLPAAVQELVENEYFIYYGNPLATAPESFIIPEWPIRVANTGVGFSYTKPQQDWRAGVSSKKGAKAYFSFYGSKVQLTAHTDSASGTAFISIDDGEKTEYSFWSSDEEDQVIYSNTTLDRKYHTITVEVTGEKVTSSVGTKIALVQAEYELYVGIKDAGEELRDDLSWSSVFIGGSG